MVESFEIVNILILGNRQQQTKINKRLISRVDHGGRGGREEKRGKNGRIIKTCKRTCILQNELFYSRGSGETGEYKYYKFPPRI